MVRLLILLSVFSFNVNAQVSQTVYYNNKNLNREVKKEKAGYAVTTTINADSSRTLEVLNIRENIIERSQTLKGYEPIGVWKHLREDGTVVELDYNFAITYSDSACHDSIPGYKASDNFYDNAYISYVAPRIVSGEITMKNFFSANAAYTEYARERGIKGEVLVNFRISEKGEIVNLALVKKGNIWLEKEALRIFRQLKFSTPPLLNNKPMDFCVTMPVGFHISGSFFFDTAPMY